MHAEYFYLLQILPPSLCSLLCVILTFSQDRFSDDEELRGACSCDEESTSSSDESHWGRDSATTNNKQSEKWNSIVTISDSEQDEDEEVVEDIEEDSITFYKQITLQRLPPLLFLFLILLLPNIFTVIVSVIPLGEPDEVFDPDGSWYICLPI